MRTEPPAAGVPVAVYLSVVVIVGLLTWGLAMSLLPGVDPGHSAASYWVMGTLGALGLVSIGWFVVNAAWAEQADVKTRRLLGNVRVGAVMHRHLPTVLADDNVTELVDHFLSDHPNTALLVVGANGRIVGLVTLRQLHQVPAGDCALARVAAIAVPLDEVATASPGEPLVDVLARLARRGHDDIGGRVLVFDDDRIVGIVSPADVDRVVEVRNPKVHL